MLADRGERLIFITKKQYFAPMPLRILFDFWDAVQHGAFKIKLEQRADDPGEARIQADRKVERDDVAAFYQVHPARERPKRLGIGITHVSGFGWAEDAFYIGVVVKQRKKHRDTF